MDVARDPDVEVFVELIGGCDYARELIEAAIESGKHVVTANKALIAEYGNALFEKAQAKGVTIAFEASVAGGIPVIKALREGLAANQIYWLAGIINGTGNFILTEMRDKGRDFFGRLWLRRKSLATPKQIRHSMLRVLMPRTSSAFSRQLHLGFRSILMLCIRRESLRSI